MKNRYLQLRRSNEHRKISMTCFNKHVVLLLLVFSTSAGVGQITNNFIDYTNGVYQTICATPSENGNASLTAPAGTVFTTVTFASYGTPNGTCPSFTTSSCNAASSQSIAEGYLLGHSGTINIPATNAIFTDPCSGTVKRLYVSATYTQPICSGTSPGTIIGTSPSGVLFPGYSWEKSTTGPSSGFTSTGVTTKDYYSPGNLTQTTWFRRKVSGFLLSDNYSPVLQINVVPPPVASGSSTATCVGGSTGTITGTGSGGSTPYSYSIDGVNYQSANTFSGLSVGNYTLYVKSSGRCVASTPVTVSEYATSTGNQNAAGTNTWIGHTYDGNNFSRYIGYISEAETFNENFGGDATCLAVTSSSGTSSIYTESFSAAFKMNSTRKGLYVVDLGSDDGSRLTVDGTLLYNNWSDQGFTTKSQVLMNLTGSSSLNYEFYENGGGNEVAFQNLTLVLANTLSTNTSQTICMGSNGSVISGDIYGTLPAGISLSGTGYQWAYSTTSGGTKTNISGATGATFTPNSSTAPFNTAGTYYLYRKAIVTSSNNYGLASYTATNESNAATVTVTAFVPPPVVSSPVTYCLNATATSLTATGSNLNWGSTSGTAGGTGTLATLTYVESVYSNKKTKFSTTIPNVQIKTVDYSIGVWNSVSALRLALYNSSGTVIAISSTITTQSAGSSPVNITNAFNYTLASAGSYSIGIYAGTGVIGGDSSAYPITEPSGTINVTGVEMQGTGPYHCFNNIKFGGNGTIAPTPSTATIGTTNYSVTQTVNGCTSAAANISVIVASTPSATISYVGSPYCSSAGTATVSLSGSTGGTFTSDAGLQINATTGAINLATSSVGTHTVTYAISATSGCSAFSTTTTITITQQPYATGFYPANPYCSNIGTLYPTGSQQGLMGTLSATPSGLSINSATGIINVATSTPGSYTVTYSVPANGGCAAYSASAPVIISTAPSATIKYNGSPYCFGSGIATISRTGTSGGNFSSTAGLNINSSTGEVDLVSTTPGTYTVTYTIAAANGCATYTTTANISITPKVSSLVFGAGSSSTRCQGSGTVIYSATANNATGITYSLDATSLAAGNSINSSTGAVVFVAGWKGTSSIKAVAAGCTPLSATHTVNTSPTPSGSISTTYTCIDGSSGAITATGNTGISPFTYSLNSGTFQSSGTFTGLASGNYSIQIKSNDGCIYSTSATVDPYPNSSGDQNVAATDSWVGHMYNGKSFDQYKGYFSEGEIFDENFGGSGTCFPITSGVSGSSIYTDQFSVKFKMNSTRTGLYVVDLGSDDGSRLTVDGDVIFNDWNDHAFAGRPRILMNLDGNSSLLYEFYENGGENRVLFNNLTLVLENKLTSNLTQNICMGNSGTAIGGDTYGTLPSGISKYGSTGYQWSYSTTAGGTKVAISGATDATFTPNTSAAPFNTPGTYYVYRNAVLSSANNTGKSPYVATNVSNVAVITINAVPSATISYGNNPFCSTSSLPEKVTLAGTSGGVFSTSGLQINTATGDIVPTANSVGLYTVNYLIPAAGGCSAFSTSVQIYIGAPGTWSGKISNDWANSANWICGIMPDVTTDVTIPKQVSNFPSVITQYAEAKNLHIATGASLTVLGTLKISGTISNNGNLNIAGGTLEMNGAAGQSIAGSLFASHTVKNLVVSNTSADGLSVSSTPNDTLKLTGTLSFGNSNSILNTGDNIALISNYDGTANVSVVENHNAINGKAIVEKYINTGTAFEQHGKSWQLLSAPTSGQTIKESWMENGNIPGNYGTTITGPGGTAAGFDMYSVAPSMKCFDETINNWKGVSSANDQIANTGGYMIFIRGDRTVTGTTQAANRTVLRSKGTLFTGTQTPITVKANSFQSVGNPYASSIDFALITKDPSIDNAFYVYDPYLYGSYGVGGYQTLSGVNNWKPVPGGTSAYPTTVFSSVIQSGQAFFVHSNSSTDGSLTISEASKSATGRPGHSNREATATTDGDRQFLRASLVTSAGLMADGNVVAFDKIFRDIIDGNDVIKLSNSGENFGIKSAGKLLSIEAKSQLSGNDTITYNVTNLSKATYKLIFAPENMAATGLQGILIDKYLKTETPVSLRDSTVIEVTINTNAASSAADRFKMVFRQMAALPVNITSIKAINKEGKNLIQWSVENESGIKQYEIEKSTDGNQFSQMAVVNANNTTSEDYTSEDENVNASIIYYRIKIISVDGRKSYTQIVKITSSKVNASIFVFPNPIEDRIINLQLINQPSGLYKIKLYNSIGQVIVSQHFTHTEGSSKQTINCKNLSKGMYQLEVRQPDGKVKVFKILN